MVEQKTIKVGIDIRDLRFAKTGQKTLLEELHKQFLISKDSSVQFIYLDTSLSYFSRSFKIGIILNHLIYQYWKQIVLPIKAWYNKIDVLFCCDYFAPIFTPGFKNVQVYHDAFFYEYPSHYNSLWLQFFKFFAIPAAKKSAFIITPSQYATTKIHQYIQIPLNRIISIYEGPKTLFNKEENNHEKTWSPPNGLYLLNVGVWEKRKNIPLLLKAFRKLLDTTNQQIKLVLVGDGNNRMYSDDTQNIKQTIKELKLDDQVVCTGYLSDAALTKAYQHATLFLFPSYNEGFGIPILEAFTFNVPVLVANNSCLPEVGGDAVISFDPFSADDMALKINTVLCNEELQKELIEKGKKRLAFFSWNKASNELIAVFKKAVANGQ